MGTTRNKLSNSCIQHGDQILLPLLPLLSQRLDIFLFGSPYEGAPTLGEHTIVLQQRIQDYD